MRGGRSEVISGAMKLTINDKLHEMDDGVTVADLLGELNLSVTHVAVERNRELVPRRDHVTTVLADGDRVEIVTLVGGG